MDPRDTDSADTRERLQAALADRYVIERELARGGMGAVHHARDLRHRRSVALKVLAPEFSQSLGADRFLREIEVAAGLAHRHIVALHDSGEAAGLLYFTMPLVEGPLERLEVLRVELPPCLPGELVEPNAVHRRDHEAPALHHDRRRWRLRSYPRRSWCQP